MYRLRREGRYALFYLKCLVDFLSCNIDAGHSLIIMRPSRDPYDKETFQPLIANWPIRASYLCYLA